MTQSPIHSKHDIIPYCATCKQSWEPDQKKRLGRRFICPEDKRDSDPHVASMVKGEHGKTWLNIEAKILMYEHFTIKLFKRYLFKRYFPTSAPLHNITIILLLIISFGLVKLNTIGIIAGCIVSLVVIFDILLCRTSVAFFSRFPTHPLRTILITFVTFSYQVIGYAVFFVALESHFSRKIEGILDAIYFSFVTITTLGYGEIKPTTPWGKLIIIFELLTGLYFLVIVISIITSWVNEPPNIAEPQSYAELFPDRQ